MDSPITFDQFQATVKSLKRSKAPRQNFITNEDIKQLLPDESEDSESFQSFEVALNIFFKLGDGDFLEI